MYDIILFLFILLPAKTLCGWVVAAFLILSSLGTKAILLEAQNLGQNGYQKYSNGLLIQWGTTTGTGSESLKYLNLNINFYDTNYSILFAGLANNTTEKIVYAPMVITKNVGNVTLLTRYIGEGGGVNTTAWRFNWFAIGRWKKL